MQITFYKITHKAKIQIYILSTYLIFKLLTKNNFQTHIILNSNFYIILL